MIKADVLGLASPQFYSDFTPVLIDKADNNPVYKVFLSRNGYRVNKGYFILILYFYYYFQYKAIAYEWKEILCMARGVDGWKVQYEKKESYV